MNVIGEKIELRAIETSDKDILLELINDPDIEVGLGGWSFPVSDSEQVKWIDNLIKSEDTFRSMIVDRDKEMSLGTAMLTEIDYKNGTAEIHIKISKKFQRMNVGSQVIKLLTDYAFSELRLNCIFANILVSNKSSQKLFEKCGFIKEGILRERIFKQGEYKDVLSYSLLYRDSGRN
ncbi:GNAT family N-acetyltransferase [Vagococcus carniphilus]|uniref:GNAT family N-acetyltransferase n=1 Tax=Vagococcus carniphilus TaxID=218144 RepID=UPI00288DE2EB|nr:GNAT family protein [Vagococcus carniphilus]MDT2865751.1 GNAT family protein [Vagococcus carniphilus]